MYVTRLWRSFVDDMIVPILFKVDPEIIRGKLG